MAEFTAVAIVQALLGLVLLAILLAGAFIYVGAKLAMVEKATFGRAVLAAIGSSIADWTLTAALFIAVAVFGGALLYLLRPPFGSSV